MGIYQRSGNLAASNHPSRIRFLLMIPVRWRTLMGVGGIVCLYVWLSSRDGYG
jgi:hypothetical protein